VETFKERNQRLVRGEGLRIYTSRHPKSEDKSNKVKRDASILTCP
jgi:hypothetical protein